MQIRHMQTHIVIDFYFIFCNCFHVEFFILCMCYVYLFSTSNLILSTSNLILSSIDLKSEFMNYVVCRTSVAEIYFVGTKIDARVERERRNTLCVVVLNDFYLSLQSSCMVT